MPSRTLRCEPLEDRLAPAAGDLDPTFGTGGKAVLPQPHRAEVVAALSDGGSVTITNDQQYQSTFWVTRFHPDGSIDPTFGMQGKSPAFGGSAAAAIAQPDGRIVVIGTTPWAPTGADFLATRLTADGQPDPSFGTGGVVVVPFDSGVASDDSPNAVLVQPDGRILLAGGSRTQTGDPLSVIYRGVGALAAARLNPDGSLDPTFGDGGKASVPFPVGQYNDAIARAVAVQSDGRVVLAGGVVVSSYLNFWGVSYQRYSQDIAAIRLTPDGKLDPTFGDGGRVRVPFGQGYDESDVALAVAARPDGRILLAGSAQGVDGALGVTIRLNPDGQLDTSYDGDGKAEAPVGGVDFALVQPDGRVLFGERHWYAAVTRVTADGQLDPAFGNGGQVKYSDFATKTAPEYSHSRVYGRGVAQQPDGAILISALEEWSIGTGPIQVSGLLVRLEGDGPVGFASGSPGAVQVGGTPDGGVHVFKPTFGPYAVAGTMTYFTGFSGAVRTATADVTGDGVPDMIGGAGPGGGPFVQVRDGQTGAVVGEVFAFEDSFTGGVFVAAADLTGDGRADLIVTPDRGGGPVVAVYDGSKLVPQPDNGGAAAQIARFFGIEDPNFRGGARPTLGDLNADGAADLIVSAGFLGGPRIAVFDGRSVAGGGSPVKLVADFFAFEPSLRNGAFVAAGDVNGDGVAEIAFGGGPGGAPRVRLFDGQALLAAGSFSNLDELPTAQRANFFAGDSSLRGGVRLALRDADGNGTADLLTGSGEGEPSQVRVYRSANLLGNATPTPDQELDPFGAVLADGVFVG